MHKLRVQGTTTGSLVTEQVASANKTKSYLNKTDKSRQSVLSSIQSSDAAEIPVRHHDAQDNDYNAVYLSAHNPQTPSNAQIRILESGEQEEHHQHQQRISGQPERIFRGSHSDIQKPMTQSSSRNNLPTGQRSSVEKLNEERSQMFKQAAENQLKSSSTNLLEKMTPDISLRVKNSAAMDGNKNLPMVIPLNSVDDDLMLPSDDKFNQQNNGYQQARVPSQKPFQSNNILGSPQRATTIPGSASSVPQQQQQQLVLQRSQIKKASEAQNANGQVKHVKRKNSHGPSPQLEHSVPPGDFSNQDQFINLIPMGVPKVEDHQQLTGRNRLQKGGGQPSPFGEMAAENHQGDLTHHNTTEYEGDDYSSERGSFSQNTRDRSGSAKARLRIESELRSGDMLSNMNTSPDVIQKVGELSELKQLILSETNTLDLKDATPANMGATHQALPSTVKLPTGLLDTVIEGSTMLATTTKVNDQNPAKEEGKSIAEIKKKMLEEQRENQKSATGHDFGSNIFKLIGIHILEMYNPLKQFYSQQGNTKGDKEGSPTKKEKKQDLLSQVDKEVKSIKATQPHPEKVPASQVNSPQDVGGATGTSQKTATRGKQSIRPRYPKLVSNCFFTKYSIVRKVMKHDFKMRIEENDVDDTDLIWCDHCLPLERIMRMRPYQRTNHYPGMQALYRKNTLGHNLNGLRALFPEQYDFYPRTWLMPTELRKLKQDWAKSLESKKDQLTFIVKPEASCQGKGIYLTREIDDIDMDEHCVVQEYINKPFLMERMKFDLRLYVLVLGIDPMRIYLSREGLARLSTKLYEEVDDRNLEDMTMHLTNYAINKHSNKFQPNRAAIVDSVGHKRSLKFTLKYLEKCEGQDSKELMKGIKDIIVKTLIAGQPQVSDTMRSCQIDDFENSMCFEILGFDIMLDNKCKPYLLEVNHSPSFSTDSPLDEKVKGELIRDTIRLLGVSRKRKAMYSKNLKAHLDHRIMNGKFLRLPANQKDQYRMEFDKLRDIYESQNLGSFERLYPCSEELMQEFEYEKLLKASRKIYNNRDSRGKTKRRITNLSQNQQLQNKSLSPNKRVTQAQKQQNEAKAAAAAQAKAEIAAAAAAAAAGQTEPTSDTKGNNFQTPQ